MPLDPEVIDTLTHVLGEAPRQVSPLAGATSSRLFRLKLRNSDVVLRLFLEERWETSPEELSRREFAILASLAPCDLPTPEPVATLPGNGVVMRLLPGQVNLPQTPRTDWLDAVARMLCHIHACSISVPYHYESWNDTSATDCPDWWRDGTIWSAAQRFSASIPDFTPRFIHRDYHPVNLLWEGDRITGVVDWINACMGPRGVDVAHCRLNLALMYGTEAADAFLAAYQRHAPGYAHDPYWDLDDALGVLPEVGPYAPWAEFGLTGLTTETVRRRLESFVRDAVNRSRISL